MIPWLQPGIGIFSKNFRLYPHTGVPNHLCNKQIFRMKPCQQPNPHTGINLNTEIHSTITRYRHLQKLQNDTLFTASDRFLQKSFRMIPESQQDMDILFGRYFIIRRQFRSHTEKIIHSCNQNHLCNKQIFKMTPCLQLVGDIFGTHIGGSHSCNHSVSLIFGFSKIQSQTQN